MLVSDTPDKTYTTIPDGWLLLSMAVRMAQSLRLDKASDEVYSRIHRNEEQSSEYEIALEKARVVNFLLQCGIHSIDLPFFFSGTRL